jgi:hypothetical protein
MSYPKPLQVRLFSSSSRIHLRTASNDWPIAWVSGRRIESFSGNSVSPVMPAERILPRSQTRSTCLHKSLGVVQEVASVIVNRPLPSAGPRQALGAIFLDRQVTQHGSAAFIVVHKAHCGDEGLDDVDLLQRSDDKELQAEPLEQLQSVTR